MNVETRAEKAGHGLIRISLAAIHGLLRLPDNYEVVGISHDYHRNLLNVYVQSDELPEVHEGLELPEVRPIYRRDENGVVELLRIEK